MSQDQREWLALYSNGASASTLACTNAFEIHHAYELAVRRDKDRVRKCRKLLA